MRTLCNIGLVALSLLLLSSNCNAGRHDLKQNRLLIQEVGSGAATHVTVPCDPNLIGSEEACYDYEIPAVGIADFPYGAPEVAYPTDGTPWGSHVTGPYPDGASYLISWYSGGATIGPINTLQSPDTSAMVATLKLSTTQGASARGMMYNGSTITYTRKYTTSSYYNYSFQSAFIHHVVVESLQPSTMYYYTVYNGSLASVELSFKTLATKPTYPLTIGIVADIGQTANSSVTRDHLIASKPDVMLIVGDYSYADNYGPKDVNNGNYISGTNQLRWDTFAVLWEPAFSSIPVLGCAGNHEIESHNINALINTTTFHGFEYPTNYPFQAYSARFPIPGTYSDFGNIDNNLYYSTTLMGTVQIISLNEYVPFYPGSPQYEWAVETFSSIDRSVITWVIVMFHDPLYSTYSGSYKEMECFRSFYEPLFYKYGVDMVFSGHVHAYDRSHPVYNYTLDTCGPMYVVVGDGGNEEGPGLTFADELDPLTNMTYCEIITANGATINEVQASGGFGWGVGYVLAIEPSDCPTLSFQPAYSVGMGAPIIPMPGTENSSMPLGFCQSSQPLWSAYRDPSFGHAILEIQSEDVATFYWNRNQDGVSVQADKVVLNRMSGCPNKSRR